MHQKMNASTFAVLIVSYICPLIFAKEWVVARNGPGEAIRCYQEMHKDGDISNLLIDVTTPDKTDAFCRRYTDLQKCVAENEHYLNNTENTKYLQKTAGIHTFYLNICPPGTDITTAYKGISPCFKLIRNEILSCGSDLPEMESYRMRNSLYARCCALQTHRECLRSVTGKNCGQAAAEVVEKIVIRYFEPQMSGCGTVRQCSPHSATPDWTPTSRKTPDSTVAWNRRTSKDFYGNRNTETEEDWRETTVADEWKKHHKKSSANTSVKSLFLSVTNCVVIILFQSLNKI